MEEVLQKVTDLNLPSTVAVIEAWSDEQSFYIFNGAQYKPVGGDETLSLNLPIVKPEVEIPVIELFLND